MFYTYLLKINDGEYYAGSSSDLKLRVKYHEGGKVTSTKDKRPIKLVWYAAFETKGLAVDFENYLKSSSGFSFRNKHLLQ